MILIGFVSWLAGCQIGEGEAARQSHVHSTINHGRMADFLRFVGYRIPYEILCGFLVAMGHNLFARIGRGSIF